MLEFLNRTNSRNLKTQIAGQVAQRMQEYAQNLSNRRIQLSGQLLSEALELDEQVAQVLLNRAAEAERQRFDWIEMECLKRAEAEAELVKLKQQQREIENSECHRQMQTKQILLETKHIQLQQIEERKALQRREACVEKLWQRAWQRLDDSREQQELYEQKLRNLIESQRQTDNQMQQEKQRKEMDQELWLEQRQYAQAMTVAAEAEKRKQQQEFIKAEHKRLQQLADLQEQIKQNQRLNLHKTESKQRQEMDLNIREDEQIYMELREKQNARLLEILVSNPTSHFELYTKF